METSSTGPIAAPPPAAPPFNRPAEAVTAPPVVAPADQLQVSAPLLKSGVPAVLPATLSLAGPAAGFDAAADLLLTNQVAAAQLAFGVYGSMALAAAAPDAPGDLRDQWQRLQQHAAAIKGELEFVPVAFKAEHEDRAYYVPLAGGPTDSDHYRLIDPLTARFYEGANRRQALDAFLEDNGYPAGRLRFADDQGKPQERHLEGPPVAEKVATGWGIGSVAALVGSVLFPPAAPVLLPVAASGLVPSGYFAMKTISDIADRATHGQDVSWARWALGAAQTVGCLLGAGGVAGALGSGTEAALTAAAGTGASAAVLTQAERLLSVARLLLTAGLAATPTEAEAMAKQLQQAAGSDQDEAGKTAAVYRILAAHALSGKATP